MKFKLFQFSLCDSQRGKLPLAPSSPDLSYCGKGRLRAGASFLVFVPQHLPRSGVRFLRFPLIRHRAVLRGRDNSLCVSPGGENLPLRLPAPTAGPPSTKSTSVPVTAGPAARLQELMSPNVVQRVPTPPFPLLQGKVTRGSCRPPAASWQETPSRRPRKPRSDSSRSLPAWERAV